MSILPYERSSCFWQRIAFLYRRLEEAVEVATVDDRNAQTVGDAFLALHGVRTRSRATQHRLAARRDARRGDLDRQGARRDRGAGDVRRDPSAAARHRGARRRGRRASRGAPSTCTRARPRSTAAPPRCSATSSPAACSIWVPTNDHRTAREIPCETEPSDDRLRRDRLLRRQRGRARPVPVLRAPPREVPGAARAPSRRRHGHRLRRGDRGPPRHRDVLVVQLGDRAVPRLPGPARRRRRDRAHRRPPRRAADERPAPDARPARAHRAPRAAHAADHAEAARRERGVHVAPRRPSSSTSSSPRAAASSSATFASPFAMLVVADLLGVPERDHAEFRAHLAAPKRAVGSTKTALQRNPLEFLYERFTRYIEARRAEPTDDVMTGLATATFPDGSLPEVIDVVRIAANLFAAGQETTVRLLGQRAADPRRATRAPGRSCATTATASRTSPRRRCGSRARSRATSGCRACPRPSAASTSRPGPR